MARRVHRQDERRGGMVRLDGFGKVDQHAGPELAFSEQRQVDGEARGFLLNNAQFAELSPHLPELAGQEEQCRAELNGIREIVLQDLLQTDQEPSRREVHQEMAKVLRLLRDFLERAIGLGPRTDWRVETPSSEPEGRLSAFRILPETLYDFASRARRETKCGDAPAAQLLAFAAAADRLAWELKWGGAVPPEKTSKALSPPYDYAVSSLADAVRIAQQLDAALGAALERSKKCGGPMGRRTMKYATVRLLELLEYYGGKPRHNPRIKTEYKGRPQTAAGQFVFKFLKLCDSSIAETTVSQFMAEAVRFRRRPRQAGHTSF